MAKDQEFRLKGKQPRKARVNTVTSSEGEQCINGKRLHYFQTFYLIAIAFFAGVSVMIIELAGARVLAPWFGNSLYTWTGLIGVILVSMSLGYYFGGLIADKHPNYVMLAHLIAIASVFTLSIPFLYPSLEQKMGMMDFISGPVIASLLLFAFPGCALAAVSPFAVKLMSLPTRNQNVGISAGYISMFSTLGSVIGTFGAGFWLIPNLHLRTLFLIIGVILGILAISGYSLFAIPRRRKAQLITGFCLLFGLALVALLFSEAPVSAGTLYDQSDYYHRIRVVEQPTENGDILRLIYLDSTLEGGQYPNNWELPFEYQKYWELAKVFCPGLQYALFLGGGGFAMPEALHDAFNQSHVEVIEIDPNVVEVGREFFRTGEYPRMQVIAGDARQYLRHTDRRYDFIFGDAFNGVHYIPYHLVTVEFFEEIKQHLTYHGVYMMNIISATEGDQSTLFHAVINTMAQVFSHIEVFTINPDDRTQLQNVIIIASNEELPIASLGTVSSISPETKEKFLLSYLPSGQYAISNQTVLTDEYNPVEYIVASARRD